jgi:hypothetical protein
MKLRRFEILLPLYYSGGRLIEKEKFMATNRELLNKFEVLTTDWVRSFRNLKCSPGSHPQRCTERRQ